MLSNGTQNFLHRLLEFSHGQIFRVNFFQAPFLFIQILPMSATILTARTSGIAVRTLPELLSAIR